MSTTATYLAIIIAFASGVPGLFLPRESPAAQKSALTGMCLSGAAGLFGTISSFFTSAPVVLPSFLTSFTPYICIDALSAFFLVPIFGMGTLGALFGCGYWPQQLHPSNAPKLQFFWGMLIAGMALLVASCHTFTFLFGWEAMAISAFFLVTTQDNKNECRRAGLVYFIATHIGTLILFALFALWREKTGSFMLLPIVNGTLSLATMGTLFLLVIVGFGLKAGIMPFHFWLPAAHAAAPCHVSAILSGVVLKIGIYGIIRWMSFFPHPPQAWGSIIVILGCISGLLGVVFAIAQHDIKRLLAYHSVENIGIIMMGVGCAMLGKSSGNLSLVVLGLSGALLHVWNHSFFKSLLFLSAGSVIHHTHTHQIDRMGGLFKTMPFTAIMFLTGAVAICGLPPLNGFISEFFVYIGLFNLVIHGPGALISAFSVSILAMIGALAGACFVKVYGAVFLGNARTASAENGHESPFSMRIPMAMLAAVCVAIGIAPAMMTTILLKTVAAWLGTSSLSLPTLGSVAPLSYIGTLSTILAFGIVTAVLTILSKRSSPVVVTWDCGYAKPASSMQYTAASFARSIVGLFSWVLRPHQHNPVLSDHFPKASTSQSHVDEIVLDRLLIPGGTLLQRTSLWFHRFQHGGIQQYILYIVITLLLLLFLQIPVKKYLQHWFIH